MAAVRRVEFSKFRYHVMTSIVVLFRFPVQNVAEIEQSVVELWPKTIDLCQHFVVTQKQ